MDFNLRRISFFGAIKFNKGEVLIGFGLALSMKEVQIRQTQVKKLLPGVKRFSSRSYKELVIPKINYKNIGSQIYN